MTPERQPAARTGSAEQDRDFSPRLRSEQIRPETGRYGVWRVGRGLAARVWRVGRSPASRGNASGTSVSTSGVGSRLITATVPDRCAREDPSGRQP